VLEEAVPAATEPNRTLSTGSGELQDRRETPPYVAALALFVFAAASMDNDDDVYSNDYYARLNPLLRRDKFANQPPGFDEMHTLWKDLRRWLDRDLDGARGLSTVQEHPHFVHIGWPMSQCLLRASDRARLTDFFRYADFEPGEEVGEGRLLSLYRAWARPGCGLSSGAIRLAGRTDVDQVLGPLLALELSAWDGELHDAKGRRRSEILVHLKRRRGGREVALQFVARRPDGFPKEVRWSDPRGLAFADQVLDEEWFFLNAISVDNGTLRQSVEAAHEAFALGRFASDLIVLRECFRPDSGWLEARSVVPFEPHIVLVHDALLAQVVAFLKAYAKDGWQVRRPSPSGLPSGWNVVQDVTFAHAPDEVPDRLGRLALRSRGSLSLQGGLKLHGGIYLTGGEPDLQVTIDDGEAPLIELDGVKQPFSSRVIKFELAAAGLDPGRHIVRAAGQSRTFETRWTHGDVLPDGAGGLGLVIERQSHSRPVTGEPVELETPGRGFLNVSGAVLTGHADDLPPHPPKPVLLLRGFLRWQLLGPRAGDYMNGGPSPAPPAWLRSVPGKHTARYFECLPAFDAQIAIYTGAGGVLVRALHTELDRPFWPEEVPYDEYQAWAWAISAIAAREPDLDTASQAVWPFYLALATGLAAG
jgi:hypothetical protein